MLKTILLVGFGGGMGSILRYLTSALVNKYIGTYFPWATFTANILGCFIVGILIGLFERQQFTSPDLRFLFIVGFCGGYTTFSTFSAESLLLFQTGQSTMAFLNVAVSIITGLAAVWLGLLLFK